MRLSVFLVFLLRVLEVCQRNITGQPMLQD